MRLGACCFFAFLEPGQFDGVQGAEATQGEGAKHTRSHPKGGHMALTTPAKKPMTLCPPCQSILPGPLPPACPTCGAALGATIGAARKQGSLLVPKMPSIRPAPRPKLPVEVTLGIEIDRTGSSAAFQAGIDPLHFWMFALLSFELGYLTPPVALNHLLTRHLVGDKEVEAKAVAVRSRDAGDEGAKSLDELIALLRTQTNPIS